MEAFAQRFMNKECLIYIMESSSSSVQGIVKEVSSNGILLEDASGEQQAINLDYVTRIREVPRNKKGKKKSIVLD